MDLLWFVLTSYVLTQILVYGKIFDRVRPDHTFFHCPMCVGFWVGVFLCIINPFTELFIFELSVVNFFICGWLSSGTSYLLSALIDDNGFKMEVTNNDDS